MRDTSRVSHRTRRQLLRLGGLALVLLFILTNGIVALVVMHGLRQANARVERTQQIMQVLNDIAGLAEKCGRDQRTYRASGDPKRLEFYRMENAALPAKLAQLHTLVDDDPDRLRQLANLTDLIDRDRAELAASLGPGRNALQRRAPAGQSVSQHRSNRRYRRRNHRHAEERVRNDARARRLDPRA